MDKYSKDYIDFKERISNLNKEFIAAKKKVDIDTQKKMLIEIIDLMQTELPRFYEEEVYESAFSAAFIWNEYAQLLEVNKTFSFQDLIYDLKDRIINDHLIRPQIEEMIIDLDTFSRQLSTFSQTGNDVYLLFTSLEKDME